MYPKLGLRLYDKTYVKYAVRFPRWPQPLVQSPTRFPFPQAGRGEEYQAFSGFGCPYCRKRGRGQSFPRDDGTRRLREYGLAGTKTRPDDHRVRRPRARR